MIKIKSFPLDQSDEASSFLQEHTPFTTERASGIQLNMGYIVITYDDGIFNMNDVVNKFRNLIGKEIETIQLQKHNIRRNNAMIDELKPKGYKRSLDDKQLAELCQAEGDEFKTAKDRVKAIIECENNNLISAKNISHCTNEIKLYEETIQSYYDMPQGMQPLSNLGKEPKKHGNKS